MRWTSIKLLTSIGIALAFATSACARVSGDHDPETSGVVAHETAPSDGQDQPKHTTGGGSGGVPAPARPTDVTVDSSPYAFVVIGDTRTHYLTFKELISNVARTHPTPVAIFNTGDIVTKGNASQWAIHNWIVDEASAGRIRTDLTRWESGLTRYLGIVGNHDTYAVNWLDNWNHFLPGQRNLGNNSPDGIYYAVRYRDALFVALDSEHPSPAQDQWLSETMADLEGEPIRWRFALFHRPVYPCDYKEPYSEGLPWVRVLETYGFDIVFVAHAHAYERTCPMIAGKCTEGGVIYLNSSGGGAQTVNVWPDKEDTVGSDTYHCAARDGEPGILEQGIGMWHHYTKVTIAGSTLRMEAISHDSTTDVRDSVILRK
jgi:hypothetical protein